MYVTVGWTGSCQVFWNCSSNGIKVESPPDAFNWVFGGNFKKMEGTGQFELDIRDIQKVSLYHSQHRDWLIQKDRPFLYRGLYDDRQQVVALPIYVVES